MNTKYIFHLLIELLIFLIYPVTVLFTFFHLLDPFIKVRPGKSQGRPIILYEHWWTRIYYRIPMKLYLERRGFRVYWINYSLLKGGMEEGATFLDKYIKERNLQNIVLVGVSIGAISSYAYLQRHNGWNRVKMFIPVGGPFKGTPLAFLGGFIKGVRQIYPTSNYLRQLLSEQTKFPERIICISSKFDEIIPPKSSRLPNVKNVIIDYAGHNVMHAFSRELFKIIEKEAST